MAEVTGIGIIADTSAPVLLCETSGPQSQRISTLYLPLGTAFCPLDPLYPFHVNGLGALVTGTKSYRVVQKTTRLKKRNPSKAFVNGSNFS